MNKIDNAKSWPRSTSRQTETDRQTHRKKERQTDIQMDGRKQRQRKHKGWKPTWALVQSAFLGLVVMRTAAFPAKIGRWICTGAIALPCASTTGITTARPRTPTTPTAMHYKNEKSSKFRRHVALYRS